MIKDRGMEEDIKGWRDSFDYTISMQATRFGRENVLKWLLQELQFGVKEQSSNGSTALFIAADNNQTECARLLIELGSQQLKNEFGIAPLIVAKMNGHKEMQKLLESHFHSI